MLMLIIRIFIFIIMKNNSINTSNLIDGMLDNLDKAQKGNCQER